MHRILDSLVVFMEKTREIEADSIIKTIKNNTSLKKDLTKIRLDR